MLAPCERAEWIDRIRRQLGSDHISLREYQKLYRLEELRNYLETHLGASIKDCQRALGWSYWTTSNYMEIIRKEWKSRCEFSSTPSSTRTARRSS